ncbi:MULTISPECIES: type II toxin-antitoxin system YafQ family toxin [unclassified Streptococcus]|uniref:type II toxin-antitoxin system YafQ family toxin n=1 Tax=unclassified Streptococcus TaxID=2608887 RepID=UPI001072E0A5|nr:MULTISPECIES: type II toxin-antitoxin system YafQ family toxin [unclassified Streptococcus]MBF0805402.1 type II toxin-antitoxin system YafQ family toxin [Streptococcus sp. 19428wA2_WM07]TFU29116.1 type II toxin-antitoxin system YafQ family toxin [Streptococcus sp. WM07]
MKYEIRFTSRFKKDIKLAKRQGKDLDKLFQIVEQLANGETLEEKYRDHSLSGNYSGTRECHIEPDWLLIYEIIEDVLVLSLQRIGSHSDLFK